MSRYPRTVLSLFLTLCCGPSLAAQELDAQERRALIVLREARRIAAAAGEQIWPGYDLTRIPVALYRDEGALLIQHPRPPAGYERVSTELLAIPVFRGPRGETMRANTAVEFAGAVTACIGMGSLGRGRIRAADVALILHESAHAFQARAPGGGTPRWPAEEATLVARYPVDDPDNNAWGQIEGELLAAALRGDPEVSAARARDFLAVRGHRQGAMAPELRTFERQLESNEGLAEYLAHRALRAAAPTWEPLPEAAALGLDGAAVAAYRQALLVELGGINVAGRGASRQRFYATGVAQALLLDRLRVADWKQRLERDGESLQALLGEALSPVDGERLARVREQNGFAARRAREELSGRARSAQRRARMLAILGAAEPKIVVDLSAAGGAGQVRRFDPMNLVAVAEDLRVHTRMVEFAFPGGRALLERPVVQDLGEGRLVLVAPADLDVRLDGAAVAVDGDGHGAVRLRGTGITMDCEGARCARFGDLLWIAPRRAADAPVPVAVLRAAFRAAAEEAAQPLPAAPFDSVDLGGAECRYPDPRFSGTALVFFSAASWARPSHTFVRALLDDVEPPDQGLRLVVIASQCAEAEARAFAADLPPWVQLVHDDRRELAGLFGVEQYPTSLWIDAEGRIADRQLGNRAAHVTGVRQRLWR